MKVLLVTNHSNVDAVGGAAMLDAWLTREGVEVAWAHDYRREPEKTTGLDGADLVISLGGDGTLLRAARIVGYEEVPILGISYGHLGFLTGADSHAIVKTVSRALAGELRVSRRATLSVDVAYVEDDAERVKKGIFCLNEVALSRGAMGSIVEFDIGVSGNFIDRLRADGFIVATATGSTGYALAAGGPIVTPAFNGMVCVPVAPHTIQARAFLTSPSDIVDVALSPDRPIDRSLFCDGQLLNPAWFVTDVRVSRGPGDVILLDDSGQSFYRSVSRVFYGAPRQARPEESRDRGRFDQERPWL